MRSSIVLALALVAVTSFTLSAHGTAAPPPGPPPTVTGLPPTTDTKPPTITALATGGRTRKEIRLPFRVSDDSGQAEVTIVVYRKSTRVRRFAYPLQAYDPGATYYSPWSTRIAGHYRFCAMAKDGSGHSSPPRCVGFVVR
jgi:hypothetical protein